MTTAIALSLANPAATLQLGAVLGQRLTAGSVVLLNGDLGSGKTTLVQGLGQGLGVREAIVSPTFTLVNEYLEGRIPLYHLDLYRLSPEEVTSLHLESYWDGLEQPLGIVAIEWASRLISPPFPHLQIDLGLTETGREARLMAVGDLPVRLSALIEPP